MPSKPISELAVDFDRLERTLRLAEVKVAAKEAAKIIQRDAESRAHGSIKESFLMRLDRGATIDSIEIKIGTDKQHWYARFFDTGTKPHTITKKKAKVLYSQRDGIFYGRTVKHPGMRKIPLLAGAIDAVGKEAADHFNARLRGFVLESFGN